LSVTCGRLVVFSSFLHQ